MSINSEKTFKKVMIENGYEFDSIDVYMFFSLSTDRPDYSCV